MRAVWPASTDAGSVLQSSPCMCYSDEIKNLLSQSLVGDGTENYERGPFKLVRITSE